MNYEALEHLGRLRDSGLLSEEEFAVEKQRLLASMGPPEPASTTQLINPGRRVSGRKLILWAFIGAAVLAVFLWMVLEPDRETGSQAEAANPKQLVMSDEGTVWDGSRAVGYGGFNIGDPMPSAEPPYASVKVTSGGHMGLWGAGIQAANSTDYVVMIDYGCGPDDVRGINAKIRCGEPLKSALVAGTFAPMCFDTPEDETQKTTPSAYIDHGRGLVVFVEDGRIDGFAITGNGEISGYEGSWGSCQNS